MFKGTLAEQAVRLAPMVGIEGQYGLFKVSAAIGRAKDLSQGDSSWDNSVVASYRASKNTELRWWQQIGAVHTSGLMLLDHF